MKIRTYPALGVVALCAAGLAGHASAGIFSNNFRMLVVAEQAKGAPAMPDGPVSCVAIDGGYIEAGDPIAGDSAPTADQVGQCLQAALAGHGFRAAQGAPSIVMAYYWGVLRIDRLQIKNPYGIKSNLMARIELVSTEQVGAEVENHILGREKGSGMNEGVSSPVILAGPLETARQDSRQPRIFVVVEAYDYQALVHREAKLLWRVKLSAQETSGDMDEVIPALIAAGTPYFGKNLDTMQDIETTLAVPARTGAAFARTPNDSFQLDGRFIDGLLRQQRVRISGMGE
jgi:hypothetical protein